MPKLSRTTTLVALSLGVIACEEPASIPETTPPVAYSSGGSGGGRFDFTPLPAEAVCRPATTDPSYKPFDLPAGFQQEIIATELEDFRPVAGTGGDLPDMLTLNESGPHANRYLYRTHETGSNGAVTRTDLWTGVTTLVDQQTHYEALDGIVWSPFKTLLFAEERIVASFKDPRVPAAVGGLVYEYNPATRQSVPRPAIGARSHEGLRFDRHGNLYGISESTPGVNGSGALYKFVPDRRGDLSSGRLYALKVLDATTRTGPAVWVALDRAAVQINSDAEAIRVGATGWGRPEDIEITGGEKHRGGHGGHEVMYVASTSEDLILRIELRGHSAYVSNYIEGTNVPGFTDPDNLEIDHFGDLWVAEDRSAGDIWMAKAGRRDARVASEVARFASLSDCSAEPTGIYFNPSGRILWVNVQHAGGPAFNDLTVAITRER